MSFYKIIEHYKNFDFKSYLETINEIKIKKILEKEKINHEDFLALLSPSAENLLEDIAQKSHNISVKHFGKIILLYTPIYISNFCVNQCIYCSFNKNFNIKRKKLSYTEIEEEAKKISESGLKHILILTGESKEKTPISYLCESVKILKKYFHSVSIEIFPLTTDEYRKIIESGVDGLTLYQEVYEENIYKKVHISGPKSNFKFRLDAAERACQANIRSVNLGALLGLNFWQKEIFFTALHALYIQNKYPDVEISISLPRIRNNIGSYKGIETIKDKSLVQMICALKLFLPYVGITISTRENKNFRNSLIPLGITKMSAGVSTSVGGHISEQGTPQFEIEDNRTVEEIKKVITEKGYKPILKDWTSF
jgi:2-iminoacetate synthase